jgi:hypothetical protein
MAARILSLALALAIVNASAAHAALSVTPEQYTGDTLVLQLHSDDPEPWKKLFIPVYIDVPDAGRYPFTIPEDPNNTRARYWFGPQTYASPHYGWGQGLGDDSNLVVPPGWGVQNFLRRSVTRIEAKMGWWNGVPSYLPGYSDFLVSDAIDVSGLLDADLLTIHYRHPEQVDGAWLLPVAFNDGAYFYVSTRDTPEPATAIMACCGLLAVANLYRRRR